MKSISIRGKNYFPVNERLKEFRSNPSFAGYSIDTTMTEFTPEYCVFVAKVYNADGRIVSSGIGIDDSMASADELANAIDAQEAAKAPIPESYLATINSLLAEVGDVKDKTIDEVAARVCEVWHVESIRELSAGQGIEVMRTLRKWAGK